MKAISTPMGTTQMKINQSKNKCHGILKFGLTALICFAGFGGTVGQLQAQNDSNPYIELYLLRITQAELNVTRQQAVVTLANARLERSRKLLAGNAVSREEFETNVSEAEVAKADLELFKKKIDEAKAYFRIIDALVKRGVSIPLCTYEME